MRDRLTRLLRWLWVVPFVALGWLSGFVVRLCALAKEALLTGYEQGKQL